MSLTHPFWLWGVAGAAVLAAIFVFVSFHSRRNVSRLDPRFEISGRWRRIWLAPMALALLFLALARPRWGWREVTAAEPATDAVLVMDTSGSMLVHDISPDRFSRARLFARDLLQHLPPDIRVGLVRVEGAGEVVVPLTLDREALANALSQLTPRGGPVPGSSIGAGIARARGLLTAGGSQGRAIILLSDGEDLAKDLAREMAACRAEGIVLDTVMAGTAAGGPIPARGGGFLLNLRGQPVVSHADPAILASGARETGGVFVDLSSAANEEKPLEASLASLARPGGTHHLRRPADRSAWPLLLAVLIWGAAFWPARERNQ